MMTEKDLVIDDILTGKKNTIKDTLNSSFCYNPLSTPTVSEPT